MSIERKTSYKPTKSDPTGRLALYDSAAVPSIEDGIAGIYEYVEFRANELGLHIKKNRGVPKKARSENMLTVEEKALYILGRATGVTYKEIRARIEEYRNSEGRPLGDSRSFFKAGERVIARHKPIMNAIQTDLLAATEAFSPLVGGAQRFTWRARLLEFYRVRIMETQADLSLTEYERDDAIRALDTAMRPHLHWFDKLAGSKNVLGALANVSERAAEQTLLEAEAALQKSFADGEISDTERISRLRQLRHGSD